ncbi:MAG: hypothetical protein R3C45_16030 [Phycisphaerales bacterium]
MAPKAAADFTITIASNIWVGSGSWHTNENWIFDPFNPDMPRTGLPTYIHVAENIINGVPSGQFYTPSGPAVVSSDFTSTSSLTMASWDGPSILTINTGATLTYPTATVGVPYNHNNAAPTYVPSGPIQPATVNLAGAINGNWTFTADSVLNLMPGATILGSASIGGTVNNHTAFVVGSNLSGSIASWNNIGATSSLGIPGGVSFSLNGGVVNEGQFNILGDSGTGTATLAIPSSGTVTLTGGGDVVLTDPSYSRIGTSSSQTLINVDNTIRGAGAINTSLINQSLLRAEGGTLALQGSTVDNNAGVIEIAADGQLGGNATVTGGSVVAVDGSVLAGPTLSSVTVSGDMDATSGGLTDSTLDTAGTIDLLAGGTTTFSGSLTNRGVVTVLGNPTFGTATFAIPSSGSVTLGGGGEVVLTDATYSRIGTAGSQALLNSDNTLRGAGAINAALTNQSTVRAEAGTLNLNSGAINTGGLIQTAADGDLAFTRITGGNLDAHALSTLTGTLEDVTNVGDLTVQSGTTLSLDNSLANLTTLTILGSSTSGTATLAIPSSGTVTLTGGGDVVLTDPSYSRIGTSSSQTLINVDNTIRGAGSLNATVVNQSLIRAEGGTLSINSQLDNASGQVEVAAGATFYASAKLVGGMLTSDPLGNVQGNYQDIINTGPLAIRNATTVSFEQSLTNLGVVTVYGDPSFGTATFAIPTSSTLALQGGGQVVLTNEARSRIGTSASQVLDNIDNTVRGKGQINAQVTNRSILRAEDGTLTINAQVDNSSGVVQIAADGILHAPGILFGGVLNTVSGSSASGTFRNVTSPGPLNIRNATTLTLDTGFTNQGTLTVLGDPSFGTATLAIPSSSTVTLDGGGHVVLTNEARSRIGTSASQVLDNIDNTIRGAGQINAAVINRSTILAEGGTLNLNAQVDNAAGLVQIAADGVLNVPGTLVGGTLTSDPAGSVAGTLRNVTNTGPLTLNNATTLTIEQGLINLGVVTILGDPSFGTTTLAIPSSSTVTLDGGGDVVLTNALRSRIGTSASQTLDNLNNTIRGRGNINAQLINHGTLRAEGGTLNLNADTTGSGYAYIDAGAMLAFNGGTLQQQTLTVDPAGTFDFNGTRLEVVDFTGDFVHDQGTYAPGASPAESSLSGDYTMAHNNATLEIEIGGTALGEFDQLTVSGAVDLNGKLSIVSLPSYVPSAGDTFVVLKALGGLTGDFTTISGQIIGEGPGPGYQIILDYTSGTVTLQTTLPGDLDGDGFVGIADLNLVLGNWNLNVPPGDPLADPSGDGFVGIADLNVVLGNWNGDFPPATGAAAIPEPGMVGLVGLGVATLARQRTRRGA